MKRNILIIALIALCLSVYNCGGGGAGTANVPTGENPSLPSVLQLQPVQYVAQTGSYIYLKAKVLDGNGMPVTNYAVTFTNLSVSGVLSPKAAPRAGSGRPADSSGAVTATTDSLGVATATLYSTAQGFVTVQASVATTTSPAAPAAQITSKKTVYYSSYYLQCQDSSGIYIYGDGCTQSTGGTTVSATPYILLYVDGNNNATYNESSDQTLFETSSDDQVKVLATVYDGAGGYLKNTTVTFSADSTEVTFPMGSTATTDSNGQAYVLATVTPSVARTVSTVVNVMASTTGGATGMVSLYLSPVTISSVSISATPTTIATDGTATVSATVRTSLGTAVPDGTNVSFTSSCGVLSTVPSGSITPFAQTTSGVATAAFKAPSSNYTCTVSATSGGLTASTSIVVYTSATAAAVVVDTLKILPATVAVAILSTVQTVSFTITGGYTPYTTTGTDPGKAFYDNGIGGGTANDGTRNGTEGAVWSGSPVTVTIPANAASGTVTFTAYDSKGTSSAATMTILRAGTTATTLTINPSALAINNAAANVTFYIVGGSGGPYQIVTSNQNFANVLGGLPVACTAGAGTLSCPAGTTSFTVDPVAAGAATITVIDSVTGVSATSAVTVN